MSVSALGGKVVNSNGIQAALNNIEHAVLRIPAKYAVAATGEMTEEYLQEILDPVFRNLALGENNEFKLFTEDAAYSALLAALSVGVLEGPNIVSADVSLDRMGQTLRSKWGEDASGVTDVLIRMGLNQEQGSDAYRAAQAAQKRLGKGGTLTNVALGSLYQNVMGAVLAEGSMSAAGGGAKNAPKKGTASLDAGMVAQDVVDRYVDHSISKSRFVDNPLITDESVADLSLGKVSDTLTSKIWNEYGVDIHGKTHVLTDNDIRHMYNRHGPHTPEALPVTAADIKMIPTIISHPDDVYYLPRKDRKVGLMYRYRHNGTTFFLEQIIGDTLKSKQMIKVPTGTIPDVEGLADAIKAKSTSSLPGDAAGAVPQMYVQDVRSDAFLNSSIPQPPGGVNLQRSLPGDIPANIPPGLRGLYRLAQEMSTRPQPREIPHRPVQQSPQEILARLAQGMTQAPGGPLADLSDADMVAMLDEIARRQSETTQEMTEQAKTPQSTSNLTQRGEVFDPKGATKDLIKRLENLPQAVDNVDVIRYYAENTDLVEVSDLDCPIAYDRTSDVIVYNLNFTLPSGMDRDGLFLHELAHRADVLMYSASINTDWQNAVKQTKSIMDTHKSEIESWFVKGGKYEDDAFISDIVSAIFKGDIDVPYSHSPEYWSTSLAAECEIFANLLVLETLQTSGLQEIAGFLEVLHNTFRKIILGGII